jgi:hypothetical protein
MLFQAVLGPGSCSEDGKPEAQEFQFCDSWVPLPLFVKSLEYEVRTRIPLAGILFPAPMPFLGGS